MCVGCGVGCFSGGGGGGGVKDSLYSFVMYVLKRPTNGRFSN